MNKEAETPYSFYFRLLPFSFLPNYSEKNGLSPPQMEIEISVSVRALLRQSFEGQHESEKTE